MLRFERKSPLALDLVIGGSMLAVFMADTTTSLGVAIWAFYLLPTALCLLAWRPVTPIVVAAIATVAMSVAYYVAPREAHHLAWLARVNRPLGGVVIWGVAIVVQRSLVGRLALEREQWLRTGQTELGQRVRGEHAPSEIGERALRFLAEHTGAAVGAFHVVEGNALTRLATRAFSPDDGRARQVPLGEGLVGQVAADGEIVVLSDVPPGYLKVASTLGEATPRAVIIAPIRAEGRVNGVMELGFLGRIGSSEREMLDRIAELLGMTLRSAVYRHQLELLLAETQNQAEELAAQQEELRAANDELEARSRTLRAANERLSNQQAELEQTNAQLEEQASALAEHQQELLDAQKKLQANAAALAQASRYKSEFLANMSHELRTPLNSTLILARLLADDKQGNLTPEQVRYAETIQGAGQDLLALIDDVLDLAKVEAGRVEVEPQRLPIERALDPLRRMFGPIADDKRLSFRVEIAKDAPAIISTDPRRLQQILKNLLSNAFKFTERGEIALVVRAERGGRVGFAVEDTGAGIPEAQQAIIFEAFRQADGTTSRRYGGTGLGLSISRELARLLGGDITVESAVGRGSRFLLSIPAALEPRAAGPIAPALAPPAEPPRRAAAPIAAPPAQPVATFADDRASPARDRRLILVIEDEPAFADVLRDLAQELAFDCLVARTADEGLDFARRHAPSAVLLDIGLPDESGLSFLDRLKRDPATRPIPVHVVSASDYTQTALELGAVGYALKPVKREEIIEAIRRLEDQITRKVRRLMLIEDDERQRASVAALLAADGVEIASVGTAQEALERLANVTFDCIVLDLALPDATGYEVLEKMAEGERYAFPPVIVHTGRELDRDEELRLQRYAKSIIIKGARSPERLLDEVALFLHQVESSLPAASRRLLEQARSRDAAFEGRRILLAEDDVRNIFALSQIFEPRGAKLLIARNGREALEVLDREEHVDLVLMDIMMPEMDGLTATREIRARRGRARLPIIALTAKAMPDDRERCLAAGANDYVSKPIDIDKLVSLCRIWMRR